MNKMYVVGLSRKKHYSNIVRLKNPIAANPIFSEDKSSSPFPKSSSHDPYHNQIFHFDTGSH